MYKPNGLDRNSLQIQLENYKLITEVNLELLDEYQVTQGELPGKLELAQSYINQSREWEELSAQIPRRTHQRQSDYCGSRYSDQACAQSSNFFG